MRTSMISLPGYLQTLMDRCHTHAADQNGLTFLTEDSLENMGSQAILHNMLSTKCHVSTTLATLRPFKQIGKGQCGTVFAMTRAPTVFKAMNSGKRDQLGNDFHIHLRVQNTFAVVPVEFRNEIGIPSLTTWVMPESTLFWKSNLHLFPRDFTPTFGIVSQRIHPLPPLVREAIFDTFAPKSIKKNDFFNTSENQDCLVRLYLGRRAQRNPAHPFRLRNFDLMVNEMEQLCLDVAHFAKVMAYALAIMHWRAGVDANDVEFVLGLAPQTKSLPTPDEYVNSSTDQLEKHFGQDLNGHQSVGVWLLDFDQCKVFNEDAEGLKQLERGFFFNDPYYPRPSTKNPQDAELWNVFKKHYLYASGRLTESQMPGQFIAAVEAESKRRSDGGSLFG